MKMTDFRKLAIASQMKCKECDEYKDAYLDITNMVRLHFLDEDKDFNEMLLNDFKTHIIEKHPERAEAFLKSE